MHPEVTQVTTVEALQSLRPTSTFGCVGDDYDNVQWLDESNAIPTKAEVETERLRLQGIFDGLAYARTRAPEYPSIHDFMEAYTEKEIGSDSTKWDAYVIAYNKVRTDNPK